MKAGRVESYIHSDSITEHKGGVLFRVECKSDAAANTDEFKAFCRAVGPLVYAWGVAQKPERPGTIGDGTVQTGIEEYFPDLIEVRKEVETALKEPVSITEVHWVTL